MGQLTLPSSGTVYVDTNVVIYRVEQIDTALALGSKSFISNDTGFRRVPGLPVAVLHEVAAS